MLWPESREKPWDKIPCILRTFIVHLVLFHNINKHITEIWVSAGLLISLPELHIVQCIRAINCAKAATEKEA